jgi:hypothetical protein
MLNVERLENLINLRFAQLAVRVTELKEIVLTTAGNTQADVDALTAQVTQLAAQLTTDVTNIDAEIAALKTANPGLDLSKLEAAMTGLSGTVSTVDAIAPPPPATPAAPVG